MKVEMENWEIERVIEKIGNILDFWAYDTIEVRDSTGRKMIMSIETFKKQLRTELLK